MMASRTLYKVVKNAYNSGRYTMDNLRLLVVAKMLTTQQFEELTSFGFYLSEMGYGD